MVIVEDQSPDTEMYSGLPAELMRRAAQYVQQAQVMRVAVRCTGDYKGRMCNNLLGKVDVDRWEEAMTDAVEHHCERCKRIYTLAEYR